MNDRGLDGIGQANRDGFGSAFHPTKSSFDNSSHRKVLHVPIKGNLSKMTSIVRPLPGRLAKGGYILVNKNQESDTFTHVCCVTNSILT